MHGEEKPPSEGKSALAILSVFTHITTISYQQLNHGIDLYPRSELKELKLQLDDLSKKGVIRPSVSP